jgi:hypothetical protein
MKYLPIIHRGPPLSSEIDSFDWPRHVSYGPPFIQAFQLDTQLFAAYFLIMETLATFIAYYIAQHCLNGCRVKFLGPNSRFIIGSIYCALKMSLIKNAFHGSIYYVFSLIVTLIYFGYAFAAVGFHQGPLQFLFFDGSFKSRKIADTILQRFYLICKDFTIFTRYVFLQRTMNMPNHSVHEVQVVKVTEGFSKIYSMFGQVIDVNIQAWNDAMARQWYGSILSIANTKSFKVVNHMLCSESRFVFLIQNDGLVTNILLTSPTATSMTSLKNVNVTPFELVIRYYAEEKKTTIQTKPIFMYSESPLLVGNTTLKQRAGIMQLLKALNATQGTSVDVPLRSLRCKNFVDAGCGRLHKKRKSPLAQNLDSL